MYQRPIPLIVGAIVILVILGGVFLFRNDLLSLVNRAPEGEQNPSQNQENPAQDIANPYAFQAASSHEAYELTVQDQEDILRVFDSWELFGKIYLYEGVSTGERLQYVDLLLKDSPPIGKDPVYGDDTYVAISKGRIQVYLVPENGSLDENSDEYVSENLLGALYSVTHPNASESKVDEEVENAMVLLKDAGSEHFVVTDK